MIWDVMMCYEIRDDMRCDDVILDMICCDIRYDMLWYGMMWNEIRDERDEMLGAYGQKYDVKQV